MGKKLDLVGKKFGMWTVLHELGRDKDENGVPKTKGDFKWMCRCDCGTERSVCGQSLVSGKAKNCRCVIKTKCFDDQGRKRCARCKEYKEVSNFRGRRGRYRSERVTGWCISCENANRREMPKDDPRRERKRKKSNESYWRNREARLANAKNYRLRNPEKVKFCRIRVIFGLDQDQFEQLFAQQGHCCAICKTTIPSQNFKKWWAVDHDHETGLVRGILCCQCNPLLGMAKDNEDILKSAIQYLSNPPAKECNLAVTVPNTRYHQKRTRKTTRKTTN